MKTRVTVGVVGVAMMAFGALRLLQTGWTNVERTVGWLAGSVVVHDGIIAPLTILGVVVLRRLVPVAQRARLTLAGIVLLTVTATAVPVLGRWGQHADNPTVLPRNYLLGWVVFFGLVLLVTVAEGVWHGRRSRRR